MKVKPISYLVFLNLIALLIGLVFTVIGFSEYYKVVIKKRISAYPFGYVNENPWYYINPSVYGIYNLVTAILFLLASVFVIVAIFYNRKRLSLLSIMIIFLFFIADRISAGISV